MLRSWLSALSLSVLCMLGNASAQLSFVEEVGAVEHTYSGGADYIVGGGLATFDCDDNELPDLFIAGGEEPAALFRNVSEVGAELSFQNVELEEFEFVTGAYPLKLDADEHTDLIVLRLGENLILRGLGECRFERANEVFGFGGGDAWTTAFSATWFEDDALPTLAFGNYIDRSLPGAPFGTCFDNALLRPVGESYDSPQAFTGYCALSLLFSDWNRSGKPDLRVSNDRQYYLTNQKRNGGEQLFKLEDALTPYTETDGWEKLQIWGMGIASADLTQDGHPELYLTSMADQKLRSLIGDASAPSYRDLAYQRGVTGHQSTAEAKPSTGWHAEFADLNHDGLLDLFVTKGNVNAMPAFALEDPNNLFIQQEDGTFLDLADEAGVLSGKRGRGASVADFNRDGLLDIVVVNRNSPVQIWRNESEDLGNWLSVSVSQSGANPDAVGAWLELRTPSHSQVLERVSGGGHASGSLTNLQFGLADNDTAELRVIWPGGDTSDWYTLPANSFVSIQKGEEPVVVAQ